jgi:hypothetical protein
MSWARFRDEMPEHAKWAPLSDAAFRLGVRSICWARKPDRQRRRPGFIPATMLATLTRKPPKAAARLADELVRAGQPMHALGIWVPVEGGWMIHEFEQYGEPTIYEPRSRVDAGRAGGIASVEARRASYGTAQPKQAEADRVVREIVAEAKSEAGTEANPEAPGFASAEAPRSSSGSTYKNTAKDSAFSDQNPDPPCSPPANGSEAKLETPEPIELKASAEDRAFVQRVFEAWQLDTGHDKTILDRKRARRILSRKREGFTAERLILAIKNRVNDPFLMGDNEHGKVYDDLESLLLSAAKVERLERLTQPMKPRGNRPFGPRPVQPSNGGQKGLATVMRG